MPLIEVGDRFEDKKGNVFTIKSQFGSEYYPMYWVERDPPYKDKPCHSLVPDTLARMEKIHGSN